MGLRRPPTHHRAVPDCASLHAERRKPGVTLELLHLEYLEQHPDGYRYTRFCEFYRRWLKRRGLSMRQVHHGARPALPFCAGRRVLLVNGDIGYFSFASKLPEADGVFIDTRELPRVRKSP